MQSSHPNKAGHPSVIADAPETRLSVSSLLQAGLAHASTSSAWASISANTRIVLSATDGPMREVITGRNIRATGIYPSPKAGRPVAFESMNERAVFLHSEVDTGVVRYLSQPCRFEFVLGGRMRSYVPDLARILDDGTLEIVEVKGDPSALSDPDYRCKLDHVAAACRMIGWSFRVIFAEPLRERTVRNLTVAKIQHYRLAAFGASDVFKVQELLANAPGGVPLGDLASAIGDSSGGLGKVCAMMVGRHLAIDLDAPLTPASNVRPLSAQQADTPRMGGGL